MADDEQTSGRESAEHPEAEPETAPGRKQPASTTGTEAAEAAAPEAKGAAAGSDEEAKPAAKGPRKSKKGKKRADINGICTVRASFNNTLVTIADMNGNVLSWGSAGKMGIKGSRKSTPFAAGLAGDSAARAALDMGVRKLEVRVKGAGAGRESAVRSLKNAGMEILSIRDITGVPHNGCRPKKKRRV